MLDDFLTEIRAFLTETGMGPSYFGKAACGNSELVSRLENGTGTITVETIQRTREFMAARRRGEKTRHISVPRTERPSAGAA